MLDKHKSALAEHLRAEKAAAAAAAEKLQEDIRLQVERLVLEHNKTAGRRLESAVATFTSGAIDMATCALMHCLLALEISSLHSGHLADPAAIFTCVFGVLV